MHRIQSIAANKSQVPVVLEQSRDANNHSISYTKLGENFALFAAIFQKIN
jgi:hypothetical protein